MGFVSADKCLNPVPPVFPATKTLTAEEPDAVITDAPHKQMSRGFEQPGSWINKGILRCDVDLPVQVDVQGLRGTQKYQRSMSGAQSNISPPSYLPPHAWHRG